jgi:molybdopterin-containing oxidoreductase family iron-sulfur binding subunit
MSSLEQTRFWRSFADLDRSLGDSPELLAKLADEFPEQAEELADPLSRRRFFQLMGASLALAGITANGCRWEEDHIVPLSRRPDNYIPGVPKLFATSMEIGGAAVGLLARSFDGRPVKIEGNPEHPMSRGKSTAFHQASILHLYDPDRTRAPSRQSASGAVSWEEVDKVLRQAASAGPRLAILSEATWSPTLLRLRERLPEGHTWTTWEPLSRDSEHEGTRLAFGAPHRVHYRFAEAKTVVALDCDFLGDHPSQLRYSADWARSRDPESGQMSRLYAIESAFSATGAAADHRLPLRSELIKPLLLALEAALTGGAPVDAAFLEEEKVSKFLAAVADDVRKTRRNRALIAVGPRQPAEVHAIAARLNERLGSAGTAVAYTPDPEPERGSYPAQLRELVDRLNGGQVDTLVILGGNPVYDAPADIDFAAAMARAKQSLHLSPYFDETSAVATWHLPRTHYLEEWGDGRSWEGSYSLRQPLIRPLFGGRSPIGVLKVLTGNAATGDRELVRETFDGITGGGEPAWRKAVQDGFVPGTEWQPASPAVQQLSVRPLGEGQRAGTRQPSGKLEVVFTASPTSHDGRFANNAWLQETPDFLTKLTWGNAALIAPRTAADLGIGNGEVVSVELGDSKIEIPAYIMPGQAPSSIALELGFGRERGGVIAGYQGRVETVGANAYPLRKAAGLGFAVGAKLTGTGRKESLASTQDHWQIDSLGSGAVAARVHDLVKTASLEHYQREPGFVTASAHTEEWARLVQPNAARDEGAKHHLFKTVHDYDKKVINPEADEKDQVAVELRKWGMTIDLTKCTGCNSCMVACQAENNVPVVGKEQVIKNREMHWIRVDRYFAGDPDDPEVAYQPVHCQQCENAPCEQVCPVGATVHSDDGLNDMAYNRCVGTRYCANNCPYKVRKFNFHYWHKPLDDARNKVRELLFNPEVTVRSRGVMEKCTWCVQRIRNTEIRARNEGREVVDGEIQTACQQACPTDAIVFGDLNESESRVAKQQSVPRAYFLLADLNNRPRNAFLARIRNLNPALASAPAKSRH